MLKGYFATREPAGAERRGTPEERASLPEVST